MPVRTRITSRGVIQERVTENTRGPLNGVGPGPLNPVAITAAGSVTQPGAYTISGSTALSVTLEDAANNMGSYWVFRTTSAHAHVLTGSGISFTDGTNVGVDLTLASAEGSSVALMSDGNSYLVLGASGSIVLG